MLRNCRHPAILAARMGKIIGYGAKIEIWGKYEGKREGKTPSLFYFALLVYADIYTLHKN